MEDLLLKIYQKSTGGDLKKKREMTELILTNLLLSDIHDLYFTIKKDIESLYFNRDVIAYYYEIFIKEHRDDSDDLISKSISFIDEFPFMNLEKDFKEEKIELLNDLKKRKSCLENKIWPS